MFEKSLLLGRDNFKVNWDSENIVYFNKMNNETILEYDAFLQYEQQMESNLFDGKVIYKVVVLEQDEKIVDITINRYEPYKSSLNKTPSYRNDTNFDGLKFTLETNGRIRNIESFENGNIVSSFKDELDLKSDEKDLKKVPVQCDPLSFFYNSRECADMGGGSSGGGWQLETTERWEYAFNEHSEGDYFINGLRYFLVGTNYTVSTRWVRTYEQNPYIINYSSVEVNPETGVRTPLPYNPLEDEDRIVNNLTNDCAKDIFEELTIASFDMPYIPTIENSQIPEVTLSDEIISLFLNSEFTGYQIQNGGIQGTNPPAARTTTERGMVITTINDNYLSSATDLSIARTMIHELVHAYILHESSSTNFDFRESIRDYAEKHGYKPYGNPEEKMRFHHEFMGQFVLGMAGSLKYWNERYGNGSTNNIDDNYYVSMAFGGLFYDLNGVQTPTDSFIAMVPKKADRDKIIEILSNEQDGKSNSFGKKCNN